MEEKAEVTFFAEEAKDPFVFSGDMKTYENILSLEEKGKVKSAKKKKRVRKSGSRQWPLILNLIR